MVILIIQEMQILSDVDKPGSDMEKYIDSLDNFLL